MCKALFKSILKIGLQGKDTLKSVVKIYVGENVKVAVTCELWIA